MLNQSQPAGNDLSFWDNLKDNILSFFAKLAWGYLYGKDFTARLSLTRKIRNPNSLADTDKRRDHVSTVWVSSSPAEQPALIKITMIPR